VPPVWHPRPPARGDVAHVGAAPEEVPTTAAWRRARKLSLPMSLRSTLGALAQTQTRDAEYRRMAGVSPAPESVAARGSAMSRAAKHTPRQLGTDG
jgi:hypothetical protein